jgi:hypothetical protein
MESAPVPKWISRSSRAVGCLCSSENSQAIEVASVEAPAARADHRGGKVGLGLAGFGAARGGEDRLRLGQRIAQTCRRQRLEQVIVDAACQQIAVKPHIVHLADGDHHRARLAHFGQRVDIAQRVAAFGKVHQQDRRAGGDRAPAPRCAPAARAFSGAQPKSATSGRSTSSEASSHT